MADTSLTASISAALAPEGVGVPEAIQIPETPKYDIQGLIADPQFQSLQVADKKKTLVSIDPEFDALNDAQIAEFTSVPLTQEQVSLKRAGQFPQESQPVSAIARGLLEGASAGLGNAALESTLAKDRFDPNSPQFTNPYEFGISEIIGNFLPVGRITKAALGTKALLTGAVQGGKALVKAAPSLIKTGALTGLAYGTAGGEAQALRANENISGQIQSSLIGGGKGLVIGGLTGGAIKKLQNGRMDPTETFLALTKPRTGSKSQTTAMNFIESGTLDQAVGSVKNFFKIPKNITIESAKDITYSAADKLISKVDDIAAQFPNHQLLGTQLRVGLQRDVINSPLLTALNPKTRQELSDAAVKISGNRSLKEAIALQRELNKKAKAAIEMKFAGGNPRVDDEINFLDTLRRENSKLIDDAITGLSGLADNPYRRWGAVNQLGDILNARWASLKNITAQEKAAGLAGKIKKAKRLDFGGSEMAQADALVSNLFNKIPEHSIVPLLPRVANQRLQGSVQTPQQLAAIQLAKNQSAAEAQAIKQQNINSANLARQTNAETMSVTAQEEVAQEILLEKINSALKGKEVKGVAKDVQSQVAKALSETSKNVKKEFASMETGEVLSDYYHAINKNLDPQVIGRITKELMRRANLKKYNSDLGDIREALNIPQPQPGSNLPTARELNLSESISEALKSQ